MLSTGTNILTKLLWTTPKCNDFIKKFKYTIWLQKKINKQNEKPSRSHVQIYENTQECIWWVLQNIF